ncbi:Acetolactate synthase I/II/III large subunit OS=Streptomyces antimycoticus OX=68175 GN=ilvB PE=3 SV=1 [Streptomyces antimycoticus]
MDDAPLARLIGSDTSVVQVDDDTSALGAHRAVHLGVTGDVELTALAGARYARTATAGLPDRHAPGRPSPHGCGWRTAPEIEDEQPRTDPPRTLSIALDDILSAERVMGVDSGNFMGYPTMYLACLTIPALRFTQAFQSIGLGLATAIGAALARPDRLPVAALGDGGALMSAAELDTVRRLGLPMVVVVYNDDAYGAEVHHFKPGGYPLDTVEFPPTDIAAVARGYGFEAVTVRTPADLKAVGYRVAWTTNNRATA